MDSLILTPETEKVDVKHVNKLEVIWQRASLGNGRGVYKGIKDRSFKYNNNHFSLPPLFPQTTDVTLMLYVAANNHK